MIAISFYIFTIPSTTYGRDDIFTKLISIQTSGGFATIEFEMHNPHPTKHMPINTSLLKWNVTDIKGNPTQSVDIYYLHYTNQTHYIRNMSSCVNVTLSAGTGITDLVCDKMPEYTFLEGRFLPLGKTILLAPQENITIKFEVRWKPGLGFQSRDIMPSIIFEGTEYIQDTWGKPEDYSLIYGYLEALLIIALGIVYFKKFSKSSRAG